MNNFPCTLPEAGYIWSTRPPARSSRPRVRNLAGDGRQPFDRAIVAYRFLLKTVVALRFTNDKDDFISMKTTGNADKAIQFLRDEIRANMDCDPNDLEHLRDRVSNNTRILQTVLESVIAGAKEENEFRLWKSTQGHG